MKSYNKCSKNKIYDLTERIILLNAALTYVENEETLHEIYLKEHITHKKNYLSYLKKNYDRGILTQDCQIYNQELIRPFFTECSAQEELLVLKNQVKYNAKLNRQYGEYWLETILLWAMAIPGYTLIYSAKVFLVVVPIIGLIQYVYNRKDKAVNSYFISNFVLWIAVALVTIWMNYSQKEEAKCMEQCVNADKSNYAECALDTCDFPL